MYYSESVKKQSTIDQASEFNQLVKLEYKQVKAKSFGMFFNCNYPLQNIELYKQDDQPVDEFADDDDNDISNKTGELQVRLPSCHTALYPSQIETTNQDREGDDKSDDEQGLGFDFIFTSTKNEKADEYQPSMLLGLDFFTQPIEHGIRALIEIPTIENQDKTSLKKLKSVTAFELLSHYSEQSKLFMQRMFAGSLKPRISTASSHASIQWPIEASCAIETFAIVESNSSTAIVQSHAVHVEVLLVNRPETMISRELYTTLTIATLSTFEPPQPKNDETDSESKLDQLLQLVTTDLQQNSKVKNQQQLQHNLLLNVHGVQLLISNCKVELPLNSSSSVTFQDNADGQQVLARIPTAVPMISSAQFLNAARAHAIESMNDRLQALVTQGAYFTIHDARRECFVTCKLKERATSTSSEDSLNIVMWPILLADHHLLQQQQTMEMLSQQQQQEVSSKDINSSVPPIGIVRITPWHSKVFKWQDNQTIDVEFNTLLNIQPASSMVSNTNSTVTTLRMQVAQEQKTPCVISISKHTLPHFKL